MHCRFPDEVGVPGPKERPALVLQVEAAVDAAPDEGCVVSVAYATSQDTSKVYPGEFVVGASSKSGLTVDTKFDLANIHRLPFDDKWFAPAPGKGKATPHPRRGLLDLKNLEIKKKFQAALTELREQQKT